jgi:hypothetical protein
MISIATSLDTARIIAPATSAFAFVSCVFAWARDRHVPRRSRLAASLTVLEAALILDEAFNGRWRLHDLLANAARATNRYAERAGPQHIALALVANIVFAGVVLTLLFFKGRPGASLAVCGAILSVSCWCVEVISLHSVDAFLYSSVDGVMVVRLAWAACSLMVGCGILWDTFAARAPVRNSA